MTKAAASRIEPALDHRPGSSGGERPRAQPYLLGLATAVPGTAVPQPEVAEQLARAWGLSGTALARWKRIVSGSAIDTRHFVQPIDRVIALSTGARMRLYEQDAPPLAIEAARAALDGGSIDPAQITDLIVVSCTGQSAPGVDVELVSELGLPRDVRRSLIGFMGCFGAISGLRAAVGACAAAPDAVALVVCIELCSLHVRADRGLENQVASALFADGAAAAVVGGGHWCTFPVGGTGVSPVRSPNGRDARSTSPSAPIPGGDLAAGAAPAVPLGRLTLGRSLLIPEARNAMSWRIGDDGCAMQLDSSVPALLREQVGAFVTDGGPRPRSFLVHPGGPEILRAVEAALDLDAGRGLREAWSVLRRCGNMSSGTILFVLEEAVRAGNRLPGLLLAFGPGLTLESMAIRPSRPFR